MRRKAFDILGIFLFVLFLALGPQAEQALAQIPGSGNDAASFPEIVFGAETNSNLWPGIVTQGGVGDCACGPCAIFNAFQFGDAALTNLAWSLPGKAPADKIRDLIQMFGDKASVVTPDQPRYLAQGGMWDQDIAPFVNDWLKGSGAAPIRGERLALGDNEKPREHLRQLYADLRHSLEAGFPPVVNLQSYAERKGFLHRYWKLLDGHFVTVVAVQGALARNALRFSMWVADSETGRLLQVSVNTGEGSFSAQTDAPPRRNGKEIALQTHGYPYLTIRSPKLEDILLGNAARWHGQAVCVIEYVARR